MPHHRRRTGEVFGAFLMLGLSSFGGPIAHLGYFRSEFVACRRWLDEKAYGGLVALCQFLPGPASIQVGFALGLMRGGPGTGRLCVTQRVEAATVNGGAGLRAGRDAARVGDA